MVSITCQDVTSTNQAWLTQEADHCSPLSRTCSSLAALCFCLPLAILVECFDASRLALFKHLDYTIRSLGENSNYLLIPPGAGA